LTPTGTDTIDGNVSQQLQLTESLVLVSNGSTGFNTYAYGRSNSFAFTQLAQVVTGGTLTLSSAQGANIIQEYTGALVSNQIVVLPSTVQIYSLQNNTTGAYTLTFKTAGIGSTVAVGQGQTALVVCDGTNVYSTTSNTSSSFTSATLAPGAVSAPSLNFLGNTTTGLYLPASNQIGFAINGANGMTLSSTGLAITNGISGGTF
jgi:archaellum component FlaG (FlaF/FlaG flagellin family)